MAKKKKDLLSNYKKALPLLHALCRMTDVERESALEFLNRRGREVLYQCIFNCVYNQKVLPVEKRREIRKKLSGKAQVYELLAKPSTTESLRKKKLLRQTGTGLPLILAAAIPILTSLLGL
jgi:hypothetical protein